MFRDGLQGSAAFSRTLIIQKTPLAKPVLFPAVAAIAFFPSYAKPTDAAQHRASEKTAVASLLGKLHNMGASITRIGFWGPLFYNHNKEPPQ